MGAKKSLNPIGFLGLPVTIITSAVYIALAVALLYTHHVVPSPSSDAPVKGVNISEAWHDLQVISEGFHPYNTRKNDVVRNWLLERIDQILVANKAEYSVQGAKNAAFLGASIATTSNGSSASPVIVFNDLNSNGTWSAAGSNTSVYFEGNNIMVYIRGTRDGQTNWWAHTGEDEEEESAAPPSHGVLVNAHYDSVSTGFGATDDGVGVISVLQLIKYYTTPGNQPKRGLVALLNNGEEDFLNGAKAFMRHPISRFPDTFLNLEGAGAGGRAVLFRSSDAEVTNAYTKSPYPFGSILSADFFKRRVIGSQTDYVVFEGELGIRGLDVAFFEPRSKYHTDNDAARFTGKDSIWHMLSAAVATTRDFTADTTTDFGRGKGHDGVWFDLLGRIFGLAQLHVMFAISVTLLVVAPVIMLALMFILIKTDKYYLFARKGKSDPLDPNSPDDEVIVSFNGWRGLFRYPAAFCLATAAVVGLAFLITKINPFIIYSSQYAVWSMMLCAWMGVMWFILRGADFVRPTSLHRAHALGWLFFGSWLALAVDTVGENNFRIAGGYFMVIYFAAIFLALLLSYMEFFALPTKEKYVQLVANINSSSRPISSRQSAIDASDRAESSDRTQHANDDDANESTSLLGKKQTPYNGARGHRSIGGYDEDDEDSYTPMINGKQAYGDEQGWSATLPSWIWVLQFTILGPIMIIIIGQLGLFGVSAMHQVLADGNNPIANYIYLAIVSVLLLIPVSPFLHRFSFRVPTFLFAIFVGTLLYNLLAFPFSQDAQLKVYFSQSIDLGSGANKVSLSGLDGYVQEIISTLPSAAGQPIKCEEAALKPGLTTCTWTGLKPRVVGSLEATASPSPYRSWISVNATRTNTTDNEAVFRVVGQNTRACKLVFDNLIGDYDVDGAAPQDNRFVKMPNKEGAKELRLWSRTWEKPWTVRVRAQRDTGRKNQAPEKKSFEGRAICLWSDANVEGAIPAFDEMRKYMPVWAAVTKAGDGLVEGYKRFSV